MDINQYTQDNRADISDIKERNKYVIARILFYLDQICKKNNINYSVACGTLIGVIREKDVLYWDSDADIYMDEDSFLLFIEKAKSELPKNIILQTNRTDPLFCNNSTFIRLIDLDSEVYPTSQKRISPNGLHCDIQCIMTDAEKYYQIVKNDNLFFLLKKIIASLLICTAYFFTSLNVKKSFYQLFGYSIYVALETTFVSRCKALYNIKHNNSIYKPFNIMDNKYHSFRDFELKVPIKYDEYLKKWYGNYLSRPDISEINLELNKLNSYVKFNKSNNPVVKYLYEK